ncbi:hypothetical protein JQ617_07990 [Bradyrhizobium sp. KB893862 SZCCT0404]|uniref:hypothetical protein n=1 Tax=Bradyrhizobium sp. KB893862 SZCCT0404 TaxID=2807672 RepID=UPI001BA686EA|nr:hypothetical protein [Bradyrhizobium sp. KB893862 SZCCT0404]MBR1173890.1 hypothetical protein [Bradyrhizobium sp. KB893862 SZCCT0404]
MAQWNPLWGDAIASIESSGGNYSLLGPVTKSGDRAYGKYQVMGNNIGPWTQSALGRAMSPQEFLQDKDAQEAVFKQQFGNSVDKYGSPQEAASVWFSGRPMAKAGNASDILGTTVPAYVNKFNAYMGNPTQPAAVAAINRAAPQQQSGDGNVNTPPPDDGFMGALLNRINGNSAAGTGQAPYDLGDALGNAGAAMMALDNPRGAAVLASMTAANRKAATQKKMTEWSFEPGTGTFYRTDPNTGKLETMGGPKKEAQGPKLSESALKHVDETMGNYDYLSQSATNAADILDDLNTGKLDLGMFKNWINSGKNMAGISDEQSRALARFNQYQQSLVNDNLRLNKGVQTEGDAYRELKSFAANGTNYDNEAAKEALKRVITKSQEAVTKRGVASFDTHKATYGDDAFAPYNDMVTGWKSNFDNINQRIAKMGQPAQPSPSANVPDRSAVEAEMRRRGLLK